MEDQDKEIVVYTDGGARGNPGPAACAVVVEEDGKVVYRGGVFLGRTTNNLAEYGGVVEAYKWLLKNKRGKRVVFKMDSELVSRQLNGLYKVKNKNLFSLWNRVKKMEEEFKGKVSYVYVPRSENKEADRILNLVLNRVSRHVNKSTT